MRKLGEVVEVDRGQGLGVQALFPGSDGGFTSGSLGKGMSWFSAQYRPLFLECICTTGTANTTL